MRSLLPILVGLILASAALAPAQLGWAPPIPGKGRLDSLRVDAAITLGVEHVMSKQRENGSFPGHEARFPAGMTALCLLTMVKCGVAPSDPAVTKALEYLRYLPFKKTYSTGCMLMALEALHPPGAKEWAQRGVDFLVKTQHGSGYWSYPDDKWAETGKLGTVDLSNTQYAILGLRAAKRLGCKVPAKPVAELVDALIADQADSGGFGYRGSGTVTGSMTVAGLAILSIAEDLAAKSGSYSRMKRDAGAGFKRGAAWIARRFDASWNPMGNVERLKKTWHMYYLYGVERYGALAGVKRLGERDWYQDGARYLLGNQGDKGEFGKLENTCFALLFLRRATLSVSREIRTGAVEARRAELKVLKKTWDALPKASKQLEPIRDWLVLGPYRVKNDDPFNLEEHPRPTGTPRKRMVAVGKRWQVHRAPKDQVNLDAVFRGGDRRLAYVATLAHAPQAGPALLWLNTHDAYRVWVNGKEVGACLVSALPNRNWRMPCTLGKGTNVIVLLLEDHSYGWKFQVRLSAADGKPWPGLVTGLSKAELKRKSAEQ